MRKFWVFTLVLATVLSICNVASAAITNPFVNPSFESGTTGWTVMPHWGDPDMMPVVGEGSVLGHFLPRNAYDGINLVGNHSDPWATDGIAGYMYQTVTVPAGAASVAVWASNYSSNGLNPREILDYGNKVKLGVAVGAITDISSPLITWTESAWGRNWYPVSYENIFPGDQITLFIDTVESNQRWATAWDNVKFYSGKVALLDADTTTSGTQQFKVTQSGETFTFTWKTDKASDSKLYYGNFYDNPFTQTKYDSTLTTNHSLTLNITTDSLVMGDRYAFAVESKSANVDDCPAVSGEGDFMARLPNKIQNPGFDALGKWTTAEGWNTLGGGINGVWGRNGNAGGIAQVYTRDPRKPNAYQKITGLTAGKTYLFEAYVYTYVDNGNWDSPANAEECQARIGFDTNAGTDINSANIIWGNATSIQKSACTFDAYKKVQLMVKMPTGKTSVTLFLQGSQTFSWRDRRIAFDDTWFNEVPAKTTFASVKSVDSLGYGFSLTDLIVTKKEVVNGKTYCWVVPYVNGASDNKLGGVKVDLSKIAPATVTSIVPGKKISLFGNTQYAEKTYSFTDTMGTTDPADDITSTIGKALGEIEILAQEVTVSSTSGVSVLPITMANKDLAGSPIGVANGGSTITSEPAWIWHPGDNPATPEVENGYHTHSYDYYTSHNVPGANNVGRVVKIVGKVIERGPVPATNGEYFIIIDDGSGVGNALTTGGKGIKVYMPANATGWKTMPAVGAMVTAVGVSTVDYVDPTVWPDGNRFGDEYLLQNVRLLDGNALTLF